MILRTLGLKKKNLKVIDFQFFYHIVDLQVLLEDLGP
jgi:hypothetical protein